MKRRGTEVMNEGSCAFDSSDKCLKMACMLSTVFIHFVVIMQIMYNLFCDMSMDFPLQIKQIETCPDQWCGWSSQGCISYVILRYSVGLFF